MKQYMVIDGNFQKVINEIDDDIKKLNVEIVHQNALLDLQNDITRDYYHNVSFFGFIRMEYLNGYVLASIKCNNYELVIESLSKELKELKKIREDTIKLALQPAK